MFAHGGFEVLEGHFAVGDHFLGFVGGDLEVVGEVLQDGDAGFHELEHLVALKFAGGGDLAEDDAHVLEIDAGDLRGVAHGLEDGLQLAALLDTGGDEARGDTGRVPKAERGALDGGERIVHDAVDAFGVVAERFEFGLGAFDVQGAVEAAFGGEADEGSADGGGGGDADFADFAECAADALQDGFAAFLGAGVGAFADAAFDGFAQSLGRRADDDVAGAEFLCHRVSPVQLSVMPSRSSRRVCRRWSRGLAWGLSAVVSAHGGGVVCFLPVWLSA